jgi:hypothetical protein
LIAVTVGDTTPSSSPLHQTIEPILDTPERTPNLWRLQPGWAGASADVIYRWFGALSDGGDSFRGISPSSMSPTFICCGTARRTRNGSTSWWPPTTS